MIRLCRMICIASALPHDSLRKWILFLEKVRVFLDKPVQGGLFSLGDLLEQMVVPMLLGNNHVLGKIAASPKSKMNSYLNSTKSIERITFI